MHHVLELLPLRSEELDPRSGTLLALRAIEEDHPVRLYEDRSPGFRLTIIRVPWVSRWRCLVCHKVTQCLTLNRMTWQEIQLELDQLYYPLINVSSCIGIVEHDLQRARGHH
jgi:hypothetical protein